jgi:hypothetical protein
MVRDKGFDTQTSQANEGVLLTPVKHMEPKSVIETEPCQYHRHILTIELHRHEALLVLHGSKPATGFGAHLVPIHGVEP